MSRKVAFSMVSSLVMAGTLWANAGPPPLPKDHKVAEPLVRFEGIDKHPDYIFYLYYYGYFMPEAAIAVPCRTTSRSMETIMRAVRSPTTSLTSGKSSSRMRTS